MRMFDVKKRNLAAATRILIYQAINIAQGEVEGTVTEAELEYRFDRPVWEVGVITPEGELKEVFVDSLTGVIVTDGEQEQDPAIGDRSVS